MPRHEVFCEDLASFEFCGRGSWSNYRQALRFERIDDTGSQRRFWSNEREIDVIRCSKIRQRRVIVKRNLDQLCQLAYTCITRRTEDLNRNRLRIVDGSHDGVLTPAVVVYDYI